jgi:hypothetical protein
MFKARVPASPSIRCCPDVNFQAYLYSGSEKSSSIPAEKNLDEDSNEYTGRNDNPAVTVLDHILGD